MESLVLAPRLLLGGVFATAGVAKLRDPVGSRAALLDFADRLTIMPMSQGDRRHTLRLQQKHEIPEFLRQKRADVYNAYDVHGTPSAVVVGPDGRVASPTVTDELAIEQLIRLTMREEQPWTEDRLVA